MNKLLTQLFGEGQSRQKRCPGQQVPYAAEPLMECSSTPTADIT